MSHCQRLSVDTALFFVSTPRPPCSPLFPYTTLFRSLMTSVFTFILLTSTIVLAGRTGDIMLTLLLTGVAGSLSRVVQLSASLRVAGVRLGAALRPYIRYALYSIPGIVLTMSAEEYISDGAAFGAMVVGGLVRSALRTVRSDDPESAPGYKHKKGASRSGEAPLQTARSKERRVGKEYKYDRER